MGGVRLGIPFVYIGALLGSTYTSIPIDGKLDRKNKKKLKRRFKKIYEDTSSSSTKTTLSSSLSALHRSSKIEYFAWVAPMDSSSKIKGCLTEVGDDKLVISDKMNIYHDTISISYIKEIQFIRREDIETGAFVGSMSSLIIGGIKADSKEDVVLNRAIVIITGVLLAISGAILGGLINFKKIKIPINGELDDKKAELLQYKHVFSK